MATHAKIIDRGIETDWMIGVRRTLLRPLTPHSRTPNGPVVPRLNETRQKHGEFDPIVFLIHAFLSLPTEELGSVDNSGDPGK